MDSNWWNDYIRRSAYTFRRGHSNLHRPLCASRIHKHHRLCEYNSNDRAPGYHWRLARLYPVNHYHRSNLNLHANGHRYGSLRKHGQSGGEPYRRWNAECYNTRKLGNRSYFYSGEYGRGNSDDYCHFNAGLHQVLRGNGHSDRIDGRTNLQRDEFRK